MTMAGAPVHLSHQGHPQSKLISFDQDFMKLGHVVKYHDVCLMSSSSSSIGVCHHGLLSFVDEK